jgi:hypothetical protein
MVTIASWWETSGQGQAYNDQHPNTLLVSSLNLSSAPPCSIAMSKVCLFLPWQTAAKSFWHLFCPSDSCIHLLSQVWSQEWMAAPSRSLIQCVSFVVYPCIHFHSMGAFNSKTIFTQSVHRCHNSVCSPTWDYTEHLCLSISIIHRVAAASASPRLQKGRTVV